MKLSYLHETQDDQVVELDIENGHIERDKIFLATFLSYFFHGFLVTIPWIFFTVVTLFSLSYKLLPENILILFFCIFIFGAMLCGLPWTLMVFPFFGMGRYIPHFDSILRFPCELLLPGSDGMGGMLVWLWIFGLFGIHINTMIYFYWKENR